MAAFNTVTQEENETETAYFHRVRQMNALCGCIHTSIQVTGRFLQGVWWEVRTDVREYNKASMPLETLVRYAQRKGDLCRRRNEEQRALRAAEDTERRARRVATRRVAAGVATPLPEPSMPPPYAGKNKAKSRSGANTPTEGPAKGGSIRYPCMACNSTKHYTRHCPDLSAETRAKFEKARAERARTQARAPGWGAAPPHTVAAVGEDGTSPPEGESPPKPTFGESDDSSSEGPSSSKNE